MLSDMSCQTSLRASSPIWASETSLARTRERAAKPRGAEERRACSQAMPDLNRILIYPFKLSCGLTPARFNGLRAYRRFAGLLRVVCMSKWDSLG